MNDLKLTLMPVMLVAGVFIGWCSDRSPNRPPAPAAEVLVGNVRGHAAGHPPRELRPLSLRVGDDVTKLGEPSAVTPNLVTVYFDASGVPVVASFEAER